MRVSLERIKTQGRGGLGPRSPRLSAPG
jgi:hypothetical protein